MWYYDSPVGRISIIPLENGQYGTKHNGVVWEQADNPQALADNVFCQCTACDEWDDCELPDNAPSSLSEWRRV
jgi:hypothetical protein